MSDSHLPDDLAQWPDDPYALLGVHQTVDHRSLRSAYVRLIRIYRPEHSPDHFRRIREAYEHLEACLNNQQQFTSGEAIEIPADIAFSTWLAMEEAASNPASADPHIDAAWTLARDGNPRDAYRRLMELERQRPGNEAICLRLYWLLLLHPDVDRIRDRRDWLVAGLPAAELAGPLMELYGRELDGNPQESQHARCRKLFEQPAPLDQRAGFIIRCWSQLGLVGWWGMIAQDLQKFRTQFAADIATWIRMLLTSREQLLWQRVRSLRTQFAASDPSTWMRTIATFKQQLLGEDDRTDCGLLAQACQREIEQHSEEHEELAWELDRGDSAELLTLGLQKLICDPALPHEAAQQLGEILRRGWVQPFGMIRDDLLTFLRPLVERPIRGFETFDRIYQISPAVLHQLHQHVQTLYWNRCDSRRQQRRGKERRKVVEAFIREQKPDVYDNWRTKILAFCLHQGMTFAQFEQAADNMTLSPALREQWTTELSLHCITTACEAFWDRGQ